MKFNDLMADHRVATVRKSKWDNPEDRLHLPPIINGARGLWATLEAFDGFNVVEVRVLAFQCDDDSDDWEAAP